MSPERAFAVGVPAAGCEVRADLLRFGGRWRVEFEGKVLFETTNAFAAARWVARLRRMETR